MQFKIALFGPPGAGKTSLANAFTAFAKDRGKSLYNISEFARDFIDEHGKDAIVKCGPLIQLEFEKHQKAREDRVPAKTDGFITDSPLFLSWFYTIRYPGDELASEITRKTSYETFLKCLRTYTHIFYVTREKPYVNDGTRHQTEEESNEIGQMMLNMVNAHGVKYTTLKGTTLERCQTIWEMTFGKTNS